MDLVFTGALNGKENAIKQAVMQMGLAKRVHFLGFVSEERLSAVWFGCEFLIFPSLYEGFGIPVLEAMSIGKPVLCSDCTSLPEVAGDAALYFDPRKPETLVDCIQKITTDSSLQSALVEKGRIRAGLFRADDMARQYLEIFKKSVKDPGSISNEIMGIYKDGWMGGKTVVAYASGPPNRILEMKLEAPSWLPARRVKITLSENNKTLQRVGIRPGGGMVIRHALPDRQGHITLSMTPTFNPSDYGMGDDLRNLSVICHECNLVLPHKKRIILR
jgi:glycosyl transferase family 1